jgi:hypothetical protein
MLRLQQLAPEWVNDLKKERPEGGENRRPSDKERLAD